MDNGKVKVENNNKISNLWVKLNKKFLVLALLVIIVIVIGIVIVVTVNKKDNAVTMTCTREDVFVDFKFNEKLIIDLESSNNKENEKELLIKKMDLNKTITIGEKYKLYKEDYNEIFDNYGKSAYTYLKKDKYKVTQEGLTTTIVVNVSEPGEGLILDNITITQNNKDKLHDLSFNISNQLESSKTSYKIEDKYTEQTLKIKLEGLGYTCK